MLLGLSGSANCQDYRTGIGFRAGFSQGITVKHFIDKRAALEGIIATKWEGLEITGLYEIHNYGSFEVDHLNWYYGGGGHIGFYNGENVSWGETGTQYMAIGVDGIIGIEYNFEEAPINIGLDLKPGFNFIGYVGFWYDAALSVRYIF